MAVETRRQDVRCLAPLWHSPVCRAVHEAIDAYENRYWKTWARLRKEIQEHECCVRREQPWGVCGWNGEETVEHDPGEDVGYWTCPACFGTHEEVW